MKRIAFKSDKRVQIVQCSDCGNYFLIEEGDRFSPEPYEPCAFFDCPVCNIEAYGYADYVPDDAITIVE